MLFPNIIFLTCVITKKSAKNVLKRQTMQMISFLLRFMWLFFSPVCTSLATFLFNIKISIQVQFLSKNCFIYFSCPVIKNTSAVKIMKYKVMFLTSQREMFVGLWGLILLIVQLWNLWSAWKKHVFSLYQFGKSCLLSVSLRSNEITATIH